MSVEKSMKMTLNEANATEHLLKTFDRMGMMLPYLILGELQTPEENKWPVYKMIIRIVGQNRIYRIEVDDGEDEDDYAR
jgi:hypothetical protein